MKVIFVGDNHICDKTPINRTDNYMQSTLNKLSDCIELGRTHKVDAIVLLGDLFEHREEGAEAVSGTVKILAEKRNFPVYITVGNHDILNSYPLEQSSLGIIIESGLLIKEDYVPELGIAFAHFRPTLDDEIKNGFLTTNSAVIWSCHASISDKPSQFEEFTFLFDNTPLHPNTKLVVSGHIHHPMRQERSDGKLFINPGAIGRRSANKDNLERDLSILLLEYDLEGNIYNEEYLSLPSARPAHEVFKISEIQAQKTDKTNVKEFTQQIVQIRNNNWAFTNIDDKLSALKSIAQKENIEDSVIEYAIKAVKFVNDNPKYKPEDFELIEELENL